MFTDKIHHKRLIFLFIYVEAQRAIPAFSLRPRAHTSASRNVCEIKLNSEHPFFTRLEDGKLVKYLFSRPRELASTKNLLVDKIARGGYTTHPANQFYRGERGRADLHARKAAAR